MRSFISLFFLIFSFPLFAGWLEIHDYKTADFGLKVNELLKKGFVPTSVSVYGPINDPRYAATWVEKEGKQPYVFWNYKLKDYQTLFNDQVAKNMRPELISITGFGPDAIVTGTFVDRGTSDVPLTRLELKSGADTDDKTIEYWIKWAKNNNQIPDLFGGYGTQENPRYFIILKPNTQNYTWYFKNIDAVYSVIDEANAQAEGFARLSKVASVPGKPWATMFDDSRLGEQIVKIYQTREEVEALIAKEKANGFFPIYLEGYARELKYTHFNIILAKRSLPYNRDINKTGTPINSSSVFSGLEKKIENFMVAENIRAGAAAIAYKGRLVYARGFNRSEANYPKANPKSLFRIASCSKPLTSILIHRLIKDNKLNYTTKVQSLLQYKAPNNSTISDADVANVSVDHLLYHLSGWGNLGPINQIDVTVANAFSAKIPVTKKMVARYNFNQDLLSAENLGTKYVYSNMGYMVLGLVAEKVTGKSFLDAINEYVYNPSYVTKAKVAKTFAKDAYPGEMPYHDRSLRVAKSVMDWKRPLVPMAYGGENMSLFDSFGGAVISPVDYVRVLTHLKYNQPRLLNDTELTAMWTASGIAGSNNYARGWTVWSPKSGVTSAEHGGQTPGVGTRILTRSDGWSAAIFFNRDLKGDIGGDLNTELNKITDAEASALVDLFPDYQ